MNILAIWDMLCISLLWSSFCRLVKVDQSTGIDIRLAIWFLGLAALVGIGAPLYGWRPDFVHFCLLTTITIKQVITARHWAHQVPQQFQK